MQQKKQKDYAYVACPCSSSVQTGIYTFCFQALALDKVFQICFRAFQFCFGF